MELIETTNWGMTKRHFATVESIEASHEGGSGYPLCTSGGHRTWTQEYKDPSRMRYSGKVGPRIKDLPLCKRCEKKAAEL
jgi:hypothetical protein